jgi:hypothetical protein
VWNQGRPNQINGQLKTSHIFYRTFDVRNRENHTRAQWTLEKTLNILIQRLKNKTEIHLQTSVQSVITKTITKNKTGPQTMPLIGGRRISRRKLRAAKSARETKQNGTRATNKQDSCVGNKKIKIHRWETRSGRNDARAEKPNDIEKSFGGGTEEAWRRKRADRERRLQRARIEGSREQERKILGPDRCGMEGRAGSWAGSLDSWAGKSNQQARAETASSSTAQRCKSVARSGARQTRTGARWPGKNWSRRRLMNFWRGETEPEHDDWSLVQEKSACAGWERKTTNTSTKLRSKIKQTVKNSQHQLDKKEWFFIEIQTWLQPILRGHRTHSLI